MDDIFVLFKSAEHLSKFRDYFNTCHQNMSFSFEQEKDGKLFFLDVEESRQEGHFVTTAYRKPTFSGVYTQSDWTKFHEELNFLKQIFLKNGYPQLFINNCFKTFLDKLFIRSPERSTVEKKTLIL